MVVAAQMQIHRKKVLKYCYPVQELEVQMESDYWGVEIQVIQGDRVEVVGSVDTPAETLKSDSHKSFFGNGLQRSQWTKRPAIML